MLHANPFPTVGGRREHQEDISQATVAWSSPWLSLHSLQEDGGFARWRALQRQQTRLLSPQAGCGWHSEAEDQKVSHSQPNVLHPKLLLPLQPTLSAGISAAAHWRGILRALCHLSAHTGNKAKPMGLHFGHVCVCCNSTGGSWGQRIHAFLQQSHCMNMYCWQWYMHYSMMSVTALLVYCLLS